MQALLELLHLACCPTSHPASLDRPYQNSLTGSTPANTNASLASSRHHHSPPQASHAAGSNTSSSISISMQQDLSCIASLPANTFTEPGGIYQSVEATARNDESAGVGHAPPPQLSCTDKVAEHDTQHVLGMSIKESLARQKLEGLSWPERIAFEASQAPEDVLDKFRTDSDPGRSSKDGACTPCSSSTTIKHLTDDGHPRSTPCPPSLSCARAWDHQQVSRSSHSSGSKPSSSCPVSLSCVRAVDHQQSSRTLHSSASIPLSSCHGVPDGYDGSTPLPRCSAECSRLQPEPPAAQPTSAQFPTMPDGYDGATPLPSCCAECSRLRPEAPAGQPASARFQTMPHGRYLHSSFSSTFPSAHQQSHSNRQMTSAQASTSLQARLAQVESLDHSAVPVVRPADFQQPACSGATCHNVCDPQQGAASFVIFPAVGHASRGSSLASETQDGIQNTAEQCGAGMPDYVRSQLEDPSSQSSAKCAGSPSDGKSASSPAGGFVAPRMDLNWLLDPEVSDEAAKSYLMNIAGQCGTDDALYF